MMGSIMPTTRTKANSLQAVLDRQKQATPEPPPVVQDEKIDANLNKPGRKNTVLIGGHFPPTVAKQLGILAAEEGTTKQKLLAEALDLLFVKKGKRRINDICL